MCTAKTLPNQATYKADCHFQRKCVETWLERSNAPPLPGQAERQSSCQSVPKPRCFQLTNSPAHLMNSSAATQCFLIVHGSSKRANSTRRQPAGGPVVQQICETLCSPAEQLLWLTYIQSNPAGNQTPQTPASTAIQPGLRRAVGPPCNTSGSCCALRKPLHLSSTATITLLETQVCWQSASMQLLRIPANMQSPQLIGCCTCR